MTSCSGQAGVYGTQGLASATNIPGSRWRPATWTDINGNFWLFGGYGYDSTGGLGRLNDLWSYSATTNMWTWVGGPSKLAYLERSLGYGQPGIYGTLGTPAATNVPGGRRDAVTWIDSNGDLWLFGGEGNDAYGFDGQLNDLWRYNISTGQWIWMSGSPVLTGCTGTVGQCGDGGVYGALGTPSPTNMPGGRSEAGAWTDSSGTFWLFGGHGYDSQPTLSYLNDLWNYDPKTGLWTWVSGSDKVPCTLVPSAGFYACDHPPSVFGTLGVPNPANVPGGRFSPSTWVDTNGNLWLLGGTNPDLTGQASGSTNDLWTFNPNIHLWTWMGGDYAASNCMWILTAPRLVPTCYGGQGNNGFPPPRARNFPTAWTDRTGHFWLFGGDTYDLKGKLASINDIWRYSPSASILPAAADPIFSLISAVYVSGGPLTISNGMSNTTIYYTTDGSSPTTASPIYSGPLSINATQTVRAFATAPSYRPSSTTYATYTFRDVPPAPTFSLAAGTYPSSQSVAISDMNPFAILHYTTDGSNPTTNSTIYTAPISVSASQTVTAIAESTGYAVFQGLALPNAYVDGAPASASYVINLPLAAASPLFNPPSGSYTSAQSVTITDATPGAIIHYTTQGSAPTASSPVYSGPISVSSTETVQAIAIAPGYANSAIGSATYTLPAANFTLAASPTSATVSSGQSASTTISVTPQYGFNSAITFVCSGLPTGAACLFSPATLTASGSAASSVLTITTPKKIGAIRMPPGIVASFGLACTICCFGFARRRPARMALYLTLSVFSVVVIGCGGAATQTTSPVTSSPVTSNVLITATGAGYQATTSFALTVN
ncbi:MAG TPA: chitobiase/beta-hexosaminidase C-terminal domain-containing protein [Acidobacteriaceae bacterium]|nr:chitobiase/beta-hexosaminidase C-terminal domain-containing protein [Acidobacteriaceae bacterium]